MKPRAHFFPKSESSRPSDLSAEAGEATASGPELLYGGPHGGLSSLHHYGMYYLLARENLLRDLVSLPLGSCDALFSDSRSHQDILLCVCFHVSLWSLGPGGHGSKS